jgi:hypothetical protein
MWDVLFVVPPLSFLSASQLLAPLVASAAASRPSGSDTLRVPSPLGAALRSVFGGHLCGSLQILGGRSWVGFERVVSLAV